MPRISTSEPSPLGRLLLEYMWTRRPFPLSASQLAYKVGASKQAVNAWINGGSMPHPRKLAEISRVTGIPLADLYDAADIPIPEVASPREAPTVSGPTLDELVAQEWEKMIADVVAVMRADGMGEPAIQQVVAHIRDRQYGTHRERHVLAEFAPPAPETVVDAADQPTEVLPAQPAPKTPRRSTSTSPRRRDPAVPRRSR